MRALHLGICIPDYEALLTHGYGRFLGDGSFAVDVGANVGFHTQVLSTYSRVIAFEPIPEHAERLRSQFADRPNVEVRTVALGRVAGKHEFYHFPIGHGVSGLRVRTDQTEAAQRIQVHIETMDHQLAVFYRLADTKKIIEVCLNDSLL